MRKPPFLSLLPFVLIFLFFCLPVFAESNDTDKGIEEYRKENFEEAIVLLEKACKKEPKASLPSFFLGMAYKKTMDYDRSAIFLRNAVTSEPHIKEALIELIDTLLVLSGEKKLSEAQKWINTALEERIFPAKTAFLNGRLFQMRGRFEEAAAYFETAKQYDPSLQQAADYQIGICRMHMQDLESAKSAFERVAAKSPDSELGVFSRNYMDMIADRLFLDRPLRITVTILGQYDDNVVLKPTDETAASGITDEKTLASMDSLRIEYSPKFDGPFRLYMQYAGMGNFHQNHSSTHDLIANGVTIQPGYAGESFSANLSARYNHYLRKNPSYKQYMDEISIGPLFKLYYKTNHFFEVFGGFSKKNYFDTPSDPEEDRDADIFDAYGSWIGLLKNRYFLNARYEFQYEDTKGANWENMGHRVSLNFIAPLTNSLRLQLGIDAFFQNYKNTNTFFDKKRWDRTNTGTAGLTWDLGRNFSLLLQYARTRCNSNIGVYDYTRNLVSCGAEIRF